MRRQATTTRTIKRWDMETKHTTSLKKKGYTPRALSLHDERRNCTPVHHEMIGTDVRIAVLGVLVRSMIIMRRRQKVAIGTIKTAPERTARGLIERERKPE